MKWARTAIWTSLDDGSIVSALSLTSPGALAMRVGIRAEIVPGAEIRFFSADTAASDAEQPVADRAFPVVTREDFLEGGEPEVLWSPAVEGEALGIEIVLPSREALSTFSFRIEQVSHIYVPMESQQSLRRTDCDNHVDVQCRTESIADNRENAVGLLSFVENGIPIEGGSSGSGLFSGRHLIGALSGGGGACEARTGTYGPFSAFYPQVSQWLGTQSAAPVSAHVLPLVLAASSAGPQGFVRVINRSEQAGTATIHAIDDTGRHSGPVSLSLESKQTKHLSSSDLERGNASIGLSAGVGDGTGHWRLELSSGVSIEPVAYARSTDGFLADIHEAAVEETRGPMRYRVPIFNPASNGTAQSRLRLINPGERSARIVIGGLDDGGESAPSGDVTIDLDAGAARMLTARQLEEGGEGLSGRLGDGTGKWQLSVSSNRPVQVMSLIQSSSGLLSNLSRGQAESPAAPPPLPGRRVDAMNRPAYRRVLSSEFPSR